MPTTQIIRRSMSSFNHMSSFTEHIQEIGYAFVYFKDELNARDAIRHLNNAPFGNGRQRLTVEWAKGERGRHHGGTGSNPKPIKTLFVINFDPVHTRDFDIKRHFERYGKIRSVRINRNYAFARFETQEGATKALQCTHLSKIFDRVISVEYASVEDEDGRYDNDSPRGDYGRREDGASASRRSPSPAHRRIRSSPEYGRYTGPSSGPRTRSPDSVRCRRGDYGRHEYGSSRRSPSPAHRRHIRSSPDYGRYTGPSSGPRTRSPDSVRHRRGDYGRHEYDSSRRSLSPAYRRSSPEYGRYAGPSSGPSTSSTDRVRYRSPKSLGSRRSARPPPYASPSSSADPPSHPNTRSVRARKGRPFHFSTEIPWKQYHHGGQHGFCICSSCTTSDP